MDNAAKKQVPAGLRRIAGQAEGMARTVDEHRHCVDSLSRIASARAAPGQAGKLLVRAHVETCGSEPLAAGKPAARRRKLDELMNVSDRHGCMGRARGVTRTVRMNEHTHHNEASSPEDAVASDAEARDPVCGTKVRADSPHRVTYGGQEPGFCSASCRESHRAEPLRSTSSPKLSRRRRRRRSPQDRPTPARRTRTPTKAVTEMLEDRRKRAVESAKDDNGEERTMLESSRYIDKTGRDLPDPRNWPWPSSHA